EVVGLVAGTIHVDSSALRCILGPLSRGNGTGNQQVELQEVAAIEREIRYLLFIDDHSDSSGFRMNDRRRRRYHDDFIRRSDSKRQVDSDGLIYFKLDVLPYRALKTFRLDGHRIFAD